MNYAYLTVKCAPKSVKFRLPVNALKSCSLLFASCVMLEKHSGIMIQKAAYGKNDLLVIFKYFLKSTVP